MKKITLLIPASAIILAGAIMLNPGQVSAQSGYGYGQTLIQKLAQKLGLGEDKVKSAFDQIRSENQTEKQKLIEDSLAQAVKDGKITEVQKQAILAKYKELQTQRENKRADLEAWAKQNGLEWPLNFGMGMMKGGFHGFGRKLW